MADDGAVTLACRPLDAADGRALAAYLALGMPFDAYLADAFGAGGSTGFLGAFDGERLAGALLQRKGTICAAALTPPAAAASLAAALPAREPWTSVVGPEPPCGAIVEALSGVEPLRVNRVQAFMSAARGDPLHEGGSGIRRATSRDLDALVPIVARYRVEDGLSRAGEDHTAWIRSHAQERVNQGQMFVVEERGRIVFTGAFNFAGRHGAGLGGIYTVPEMRGRGIATRATADLCRIAFEQGPVATLHVDPRNARAIRAYENAGLRLRGEFRLTFR